MSAARTKPHFDVGENLSALRRIAELSQKDFGKHVGLRQEKLSQFETGAVRPGRQALESIHENASANAAAKVTSLNVV